MRTNLPVTQSEHTLREDHLLVSKTDLEGRITYVNKDFLEVSGFTEPELLGQPHNMVRHPDMPSEAFADMWQTLKEGRPWTGYVKNRRKNGDFYWVLANTAPITENGQVTGYISVRRQATRQAIAEHEALYQRFREDRQGSLVIKYGQVIKPSLWNFKNTGIGTKIWAGIGIIILFSAIAIGSSWQGMDKTQVRFASYLQNEQKLLDDYSEMYAQGLQMGQALRNIILDPANDKAYKNLLQARQDFKTHMAEALAVPALDAEQRKALETITTLSDKQFAIQSTIVEMAKTGKLSEAQSLLNQEETPLWRKYKEYLLDGRKSLTAKSVQGQEEVAQMVSNASRLSFLSGLLALLIAGFAAALLSRMIRRPLQEMDDTFTKVLQGNYSNVIDIARNDEIGKAMQGLQIMQTRMGFEVVESKRQADEMTRIKIALDCVGTPVRITDTEGTVIYANKALFAALRRIEHVLKAQKPSFCVDNFVGSRIGDLYANPNAEQQRLANLTAPAETEKQIGDRTFSVMTSPVFTDKGERLGTVGEWLDRTDEILVEKEISAIVANAAQGDLNGRIELAGKDGFFATLTHCVNDLLDTTQKALLATSEVLGRVAGGDLTRTMEQDYGGIFGQLKGDTNTTVEHLREVVGQIIEATDAINTAAKEIASGNQDLSNRTEEQASSLEETASSMDQLTTMVKQNADNARNANELAGNAQQVAVQGGEIVGQVVNTMSAIHQSSQKIADIIGVIDNIAFQTNILALNAAVEAARAGEQGRGFAVVATEVRNLSKRSADAAKEIKDLISDSVSKVEIGDKLVAQAGNTMAEVVSSIKRVANIMAEISHASREQSLGIEQVSQAVGQMDSVTQQNAALVEQAAAAAESLEEQASSLVQAVRRFKLSETGSKPLAALPHNKPRHLPPPVATPAVAAQRQTAKLAAPQEVEDEWAEF